MIQMNRGALAHEGCTDVIQVRLREGVRWWGRSYSSRVEAVRQHAGITRLATESAIRAHGLLTVRL